MGLSLRHKQQRDRALARKLLWVDAELPKTVLGFVFKMGDKLKPVVTLADFLFLRRRQAHADTAVVAHLVGNGFLRPESGIKSHSYRLTQKGRLLLQPGLPPPNT